MGSRTPRSCKRGGGGLRGAAESSCYTLSMVRKIELAFKDRVVLFWRLHPERSCRIFFPSLSQVELCNCTESSECYPRKFWEQISHLCDMFFFVVYKLCRAFSEITFQSFCYCEGFVAWLTAMLIWQSFILTSLLECLASKPPSPLQQFPPPCSVPEGLSVWATFCQFAIILCTIYSQLVFWGPLLDSWIQRRSGSLYVDACGKGSSHRFVQV